MSSHDRHRGPAPEDPRLFSPQMLPSLRSASSDLAWLLTRGYASPSSLKIVGDRYNLEARQRNAVQRSTCSDPDRDARLKRKLTPESAGGQPLLIDAYNVLTTLEVALAHGVILRARDHAHRDIASIHGAWRKTAETPAALHFLGQTLIELKIPHAHFLLDAPVSNSARLATLMRDLAKSNQWKWQIDLVPNPDPLLIASTQPISTADSAILDATTAPWLDLPAQVLSRHIPNAWIIDLT